MANEEQRQVGGMSTQSSLERLLGLVIISILFAVFVFCVLLQYIVNLCSGAGVLCP